MRNMKTGNKVTLPILVLIVLATVFLLNWNLPEYEFFDSGYATGSTISIDGVIYEEINEGMYEKIYGELKAQGICQDEYEAFGRISYIMAQYVWEYRIYGSKSEEERILLKGIEDYAFNDANLPEIYFCRQDILQSFGDLETE